MVTPDQITNIRVSSTQDDGSNEPIRDVNRRIVRFHLDGVRHSSVSIPETDICWEIENIPVNELRDVLSEQELERIIWDSMTPESGGNPTKRISNNSVIILRQCICDYLNKLK